jgi:hypothetical protein
VLVHVLNAGVHMPACCGDAANIAGAMSDAAGCLILRAMLRGVALVAAALYVSAVAPPVCQVCVLLPHGFV